ncbi:hypothetical protein RD792_005508, partial [Penstemon davidsonii]
MMLLLIGKLASTSLMRCNVGSLDAAVKVQTLEVNGASADEVRNFEYCCLGEVRMLSVLKHSCIVDFYGHQISSKWSLTEDGNAEGRTLQSAILMEYINGGSLKSYVEKLSGAGEKHVSLDLALSIARDVAFALTELHSKHIIHRDIKSENILIDLDKKKQDGTPIVKICDFDRAIPLHSYLHKCCIAHVGVPPPDICVGTPRWMAPEVFRAMHERNLNGLEVDIWSFGCLLLELLTLQVPYSGLPDSDTQKFLQMGERPRLTEELEALAQSEDKDLETESETLKFISELYHHCTEKNPADCPSAENISNSLLAFSSSVTASRSSEQGCEREVPEAAKGSSDELKSECIMRLSWALVHSRRAHDVQRGIAMLEVALFFAPFIHFVILTSKTHVAASLAGSRCPLQVREKLYLLAIGYFRSGDYSRSRELIDRCLEMGVIGIGIGIAATAVWLLAGGISAALSARKKGKDDLALVRTLPDYAIRHHFPHLENISVSDSLSFSTGEGDDSVVDLTSNKYVAWAVEVAERAAFLVAHWQGVGFTNGVLNTDNMSVLGLTIDYGPFGFLDAFDPGFTPNTTDLPRRRYCFANQSDVGLWNIAQFATTLSATKLINDKEANYAMERYGTKFMDEYEGIMTKKVALLKYNKQLISEVLKNMAVDKVDYTNFFRLLSKIKAEPTIPEDELLNPLKAVLLDIYKRFCVALLLSELYADTLHRFWKKEHDLGWKFFMELSKVSEGFIDADTLIIKAQVQVISERADRPFRCLHCQYRRELVRVYLTNVEQICRRFVEERRGKLGKLIEDKARWSSGLKALEGQYMGKKSKGKYLEAAEKLPTPIIRIEKDTFILGDDVLLLLERAALESLSPKDEKGPQNRTK